MFSRRENRDAEDRHWRVRVERGDKVLIASISAGVVFLADDDVRLVAPPSPVKAPHPMLTTAQPPIARRSPLIRPGGRKQGLTASPLDFQVQVHVTRRQCRPLVPSEMPVSPLRQA